ncbi:cell envelope integrity protein TolA [Candidatus Coxiella mudrowiae]|uniref:Protein TolA n=1 Tax=Candidatus Coxiella mudrowiae TaxID=2054173 RepID=A0ABN4HQS0_9COXI|nr:cell envelope integrity protein TolA [Candidatus Coxiella mudrowiae]AKQ33978.1 Protein TolA [Candidatus Coxiella mudrowiae]
MLKIPPPYRLPVGVSIFCHIILLIALTINLSSSNTYRLNNPSRPMTIIKAETVNQVAIDNEINAMKKEEKQKREAEQARARALQERVQALKKQQIAEQKRLAALHAKQLRLKQQEEEALAQKKGLALKKQEKIKQHQLASKQQQLQQQLLQQEIQREQAQVAKARQTAQNQGVLDQYKAQIIQAIQRQWIVPENADKNLSCILLIHLAPGGVVLLVTTLKSSGDPVLDQSARMAVFKASPLPVSQDTALFSQFRELRLTVRPLQAQANS